MDVVELRSALSDVDKSKIAAEIFWWLKENIVNYIDTHNFTYSLSFLAHEEKMPETAKIEHLFSKFNAVDMSKFEGMSEKEIFESEEITKDAENQEEMNLFMESVRTTMIENKDLLADYFKELSEYYKVVGFYRDTPLVKSLDGYIDIEYLSFENITVEVTKSPLIPIYDSDGHIIDYKKDDSKKETLEKMPASFCIDLTINLWEEKNEFSLF